MIYDPNSNQHSDGSDTETTIPNTIQYKGNKYRIRELLVKLPDGAEMDITVAGKSLADVLFTDDNEPVDEEAELIDEDIYYYTDNINLPAEEICATGLDEPMTLIKEY